mgnify:CR=1 FL=1
MDLEHIISKSRIKTVAPRQPSLHGFVELSEVQRAEAGTNGTYLGEYTIQNSETARFDEELFCNRIGWPFR